MRCPKSRFQIQIIVFDELELIIFVSQGLTLSTASLVVNTKFTLLKQVSVKILDSEAKYWDSRMTFVFHRDVTITESYIPDFSYAGFLAEVGGTLGLWLGVGAVQLIESFYTITDCFKRSKY